MASKQATKKASAAQPPPAVAPKRKALSLYVRKLVLAGFRGINSGELLLERRTVLVGPNACGKSTIIDAIALLFGRTKLVRMLTEHDFYGGDPGPSDRFRIVATIAGFPTADFAHYPEWFRSGRAVPKWMDRNGTLSAKHVAGSDLCAEIGFAGRFDADELEVETIRYFCDAAAASVDPFDDTFPAEHVPAHLLHELGLFVLPARRGWEASVSFASELFRRTVSNAAGLPASEIIELRNQLRAPAAPIENSPKLSAIVESINKRLEGLVVERPKLKLLLTAADSEAVLTALLPHYAMEGRTLPASRHGSGLVSLQTLLLLLEIGRLRTEQGLNFMLALEEPELHLAPGIQTRLIAEANRAGSQTLATTHSSKVASVYLPPEVQILHLAKGQMKAVRLLDGPLPATATNTARRLFYQNKSKLIEALMHPFVLVPEGALDVEWLTRLASVGEAFQTHPPFTSVFGLAPTDNAAVPYVVSEARKRRPNVVALTDGDAPGRGYEKDVRSQNPDVRCIGWKDGWTMEDVVGWVIAADVAMVPLVAATIGSVPCTKVEDIVAQLKKPSDGKSGSAGPKGDLIVHDAIVGQLSEDCLRRVGILLDALVCCAVGTPHPAVQPVPSDAGAFRFEP